MYDLIKILAEIKLFSGENLRQTPFKNGYRPAFYFKGANTKLSGSIEILGSDIFEPGTTGIVHITFIKGIIRDSYFEQGNMFSFSEGGKHILGEGLVIEKIK